MAADPERKLKSWGVGQGCKHQLDSFLSWPHSPLVGKQPRYLVLMLSFDYSNIQTDWKAPINARAEVHTQGAVSLEMFQL